MKTLVTLVLVLLLVTPSFAKPVSQGVKGGLVGAAGVVIFTARDGAVPKAAGKAFKGIGKAAHKVWAGKKGK